MNIKIKPNHENFKMPERAHDNDTGWDVFAAAEHQWVNDNTIEYDLGFSVEIPEGYYLELHPRSSVSKTDLVLANSVGIIDEGYRGPVKARFKCFDSERGVIYNPGDKIAQLVLRKRHDMEFELVEELTETQRGEGGFGSTGN